MFKDFDLSLFCILNSDKEIREELIANLEHIEPEVYEKINEILMVNQSGHYVIENPSLKEIYDLYLREDNLTIYQELYNIEHKSYDLIWSLSLNKIDNNKSLRYVGTYYKYESYPGKTYELDFSPLGDALLANGKLLSIVNIVDYPSITKETLNLTRTYKKHI